MSAGKDRLRIHELEVLCVIGTLPEEREREQRVLVDVTLQLDARQAAASGDLERSCDYLRAAEGIAHLLKFRRYRLLETAGEELSAMLLASHAEVGKVRLSVQKPGALQGRARAASFELSRRRGKSPGALVPTEFGATEVVYESRESVHELLHVEPGAQVPVTPASRYERTLQWAITGTLRAAPAPGAPLGSVVTGPLAAGAPFSGAAWVENAGSSRALLFRCGVLARP